MNKYLQPMVSLEIGATKGTYNYQTAKKVFNGGLDQDFEKWGIIFSAVTPRALLAIDKIAITGKFNHFFGETAEELERRRITGSPQFLKFFQDHPAILFNKEEVLASFTILTAKDQEVAKDLSNTYVGCVSIHDATKMYACIHPFECDRDWRANSYRALRPAYL